MKNQNVFRLENGRSWIQITIARLISLASTVLISTLLARQIGSEGQGKVVLILTIGQISSVLLSLSIDQAFLTKTASFKNYLALATNSYMIAFLVFGTGLVSATIWFTFFPNVFQFTNIEKLSFYLILFSSLVTTISTSLFLLEGKILHYTITVLFQSIFILLSLIVLVWQDKLSVVSTLLAYAINMSISAFLALIMSRVKSITLSFRIQKEILQGGLKYHLGTIARFLHFRIDVVLIGLLMDLESVAVYAIAVNFVELLFVFTDSLANSRLKSIGSSTFTHSYGISKDLISQGLFLGIIFCIFLSLTKDSIVNILFGENFTLSSKIIPYFFPGVLILAIARGTYAFCTKLDSPLFINVIAITTTLLNITLNLLLIPMYGLIGAAIASTVSYSAMGFSYIFWFLKEKSNLPKLEMRMKDV